MTVPPHYTPIVRHKDLLFTSGQLPILDRATKLCPEGIMAQTLLVLQKVEDLLTGYDLDRRHIIKTTAFITDISHWATVNEAYHQFFGPDHKPARSIIPVAQLHFDCLIELEAIASF